MRVTQFFLTAVAVLTLGAGNLSAQNLTPGYDPFQAKQQDTSAGIYDLEHRLFQLEEEMKKKADKVDTTKAFDVRLNGRVFFEAVSFTNDVVREDETGTANRLGAREVHIGIAGSGYRIFEYSVELGYASSAPLFRDVVFGIRNVPGLDYVRIGHFKVETGFGLTASGLNTTGMELPTASTAFSPNRRVGVGQTYYFADERVRWFNGVFASQATGPGSKVNTDPQGAIYNSRLTFVPHFAKDGAEYFHIGGHYMYRENPGTATVENMNDPFTSPGGGVGIGGFNGGTWWTITADAKDYHQAGFEAIWGNGPLAISTELFVGSFGNGRDMYGGYIEARYFLTGDVRAYNKRNGVPGGVRLKNNFLCVEEFIQTCHGKAKGFGIQSIGAWEVFTQWSFTDSDRVARSHENARGGRTIDTVVGLNWYLNPTTRMMFEYVHSVGTPHGGSRDSADIFATNLRYNF